jgi:hypothetical protein
VRLARGVAVSTRVLCRETGSRIRLTGEIARSGEGTVYRTSREDWVAKLYHRATPERARKLEVMLTNPPADPTSHRGHVSIAWPQDLLTDPRGRCLGFVMPTIRGAVSLNAIYNPKLRKKQAQGFDWYYLHTVALNVAWITQALHAKGYVIGDIKTDNLLVNDRALVSIIDTDSFQVPDPANSTLHRCVVGSEGFTPAELIGRPFTAVDRTELHDRFGLAVLIHLLLFGYHPFTGTWQAKDDPPPRDELIRRGYWPYKPGSPLGPGPLAVPLEVLHGGLEALVRRAFGQGHARPDLRPSAAEWHEALRAAREELVPCAAAPGHFHDRQRAQCPWCERKRRLGTDVFAAPPGVDAGANTLVRSFERALAQGDERAILALWQRHETLRRHPRFEGQAPAMAALEATLAGLDAFIAAYRAEPTAETRLWRLWQRTPALAAARATHGETIDGRTIFEIANAIGRRVSAIERLEAAVQRADRRRDETGEREVLATATAENGQLADSVEARARFRGRLALAERRLAAWARLQAALDAGDADAAVEAWDDGRLLGRFAPAEARHTEIASLIARGSAKRRLAVALATDDDGRIRAAWDEASTETFAAAEPRLVRVRAAFAAAPVQALVPAPLGALGREPGCLRLRWLWPAGGPELCCIAVRGDRFPEHAEDTESLAQRRLVTRARYLAQGDATIPWQGPSPHVCVWPAARIAGRVVAQGQPLRLGGPLLPVLRYRIGRQRIALRSSAPLELPELVVLAAHNRPPVWGDPVAVELARLPAGPAPRTEPLPALPAGQLVVRLFPAEASALARFALRHPRPDRGS